MGAPAPILLVTVRIIQGLAFGAEWEGAILMSYEHAPWKKNGRYTGIVQADFPWTAPSPTLVFFFSIHLGGDWAWRMLFLASAVLAIVGLIIRPEVPEVLVFEDVKNQGNIIKSPIIEVVKERLAKTSCAASVFALPKRPATSVKTVTYMLSCST